MDALYKVVHNVETNEIIEIPLSNDELLQRDIDIANFLENKTAKAATREAVLAKLGLTADEVAALLG